MEVLQKVSDNVAALEATERAHSRPLNTDIAGSGEREQRAEILRQWRACISIASTPMRPGDDPV
jgi:hypothetical protein